MAGARSPIRPAGSRSWSRTRPALSRYRFGLGTAEFLVCRTCGVYVGAVMSEAGSAYAIVNVNALATPEVFAATTVPVSYERELEAERRARRRSRWTPARVSEPAGGC